MPTNVVTATTRRLLRAIGGRNGDARGAGAAEVADEGAAIESGAADRGDAHTSGDTSGGGDEAGVEGATPLTCAGAKCGDDSTESGGIVDAESTVIGCGVELLTCFGANNAER